ncbi:hypothetical protein NC653_001698 [Populus alba x Populus x berolinensis]|uniref:Uncharacterized protein n=1 Tax=Populus alba x Populus x berolinensis TaxID=444605 RepID=A0AAD6WFU7_9ROSI|nr:hypothetical protein NC653_001698 [Populus alba x Populus x berolinensis]
MDVLYCLLNLLLQHLYSTIAGGTQRLPRLVGKSLAKELIFTGRKINGREAMSMGLVNYSVPAGEAHSKALEIAREIIQKGPIAIRMAKKAINEGLEIDLPSALELEEECYEQLLNTKDRLEGLAAFAEKRKPRLCQIPARSGQRCYKVHNLKLHIKLENWLDNNVFSSEANLRLLTFFYGLITSLLQTLHVLTLRRVKI